MMHGTNTPTLRGTRKETTYGTTRAIILAAEALREDARAVKAVEAQAVIAQEVVLAVMAQLVAQAVGLGVVQVATQAVGLVVVQVATQAVGLVVVQVAALVVAISRGTGRSAGPNLFNISSQLDPLRRVYHRRYLPPSVVSLGLLRN